MKTIMKTTMFAVGAMLSLTVIGQVGLGLTGTTQAALNATASTATITQGLNAVKNATKSAVQSSTQKASTTVTNLKGRVRATNDKTTTTVSDVKNELKKSSDVSLTGDLKSSINGKGSGQSQEAGLTTGTSSETDLNLNGNTVFENGEKISGSAEKNFNQQVTKAETKLASGSEKAAANIKTKAGSTKQSASDISKDASVKANGEVSTAANVSVVKQ